MFSIGMAILVGTEMAYPLFSQTMTSGTFQSVAMLSVSKNAPSQEAPSPKKTTTTRPFLRSLLLSAKPAAIGMWAATIALLPQNSLLTSQRCIEPPRPPQQPVSLHSSSAMRAFTSSPLAIAWPCPR